MPPPILERFDLLKTLWKLSTWNLDEPAPPGLQELNARVFELITNPTLLENLLTPRAPYQENWVPRLQLALFTPPTEPNPPLKKNAAALWTPAIIEFVDAIYSADVDIWGIPANGKREGFRYPEYKPRVVKYEDDPTYKSENKPLKRSTRWKAETTGNWHAEVRPEEGTDRSMIIGYYNIFKRPFDKPPKNLHELVNKVEMQPVRKYDIPVEIPICGFYAVDPQDEDYNAPVCNPIQRTLTEKPWGGQFAEFGESVEPPPSNHFELRYKTTLRGGGGGVPLLGILVHGLEVGIGEILSDRPFYLGAFLLAFGLTDCKEFEAVNVPCNTLPRDLGALFKLFSFMWDGRRNEYLQRSPYYLPNQEDTDRVGYGKPSDHYYVTVAEELADRLNALKILPKKLYHPDIDEDDHYPTLEAENADRERLGLKLRHPVDPDNPDHILEKPNPLWGMGEAALYHVRLQMRDRQIKMPIGFVQLVKNYITDFRFTRNKNGSTLTLQDFGLGNSEVTIKETKIQTPGFHLGKVLIDKLTNFSLEGLKNSEIAIEDFTTQLIKISGAFGSIALGGPEPLSLKFYTHPGLNEKIFHLKHLNFQASQLTIKDVAIETSGFQIEETLLHNLKALSLKGLMEATGYIKIAIKDFIKASGDFGNIQIMGGEPIKIVLFSDPLTHEKSFNISNLKIGPSKFKFGNFILETKSGVSIASIAIDGIKGFGPDQIFPVTLNLQGIKAGDLKLTHAQSGEVILHIKGTPDAQDEEIKNINLHFNGESILGDVTGVTVSSLSSTTEKFGAISVEDPFVDRITFSKTKETLHIEASSIGTTKSFSITRNHKNPFEFTMGGKLVISNLLFDSKKQEGSNKIITKFDIRGENVQVHLDKPEFGNFQISTIDPKNSTNSISAGTFNFENEHISLDLNLPYLGLAAQSKFLTSDLKDSFVRNASIHISPETSILEGDLNLHLAQVKAGETSFGIPDMRLVPDIQDVQILGFAKFTRNKDGWVLTKKEGTSDKLQVLGKFGATSLRHKPPFTEEQIKQRPHLKLVKTEVVTSANLSIDDIRTISYLHAKKPEESGTLDRLDFGALTISNIRGTAEIWGNTFIWGRLRALLPAIGGSDESTPRMPKVDKLISHLPLEEQPTLKQGDFLRIGRTTVNKTGPKKFEVHFYDFLLKLHENKVPDHKFRAQYFIVGFPELIINPRRGGFISTGDLPVYGHILLDATEERGGNWQVDSHGSYTPPEIEK
ncbi:MAG: hypothetical protein HYU97_11610 [Deltaproteobacteria bacterium]|nr:hypothetical protein [Deltaproteobacteria bacterium]